MDCRKWKAADRPASRVGMGWETLGKGRQCAVAFSRSRSRPCTDKHGHVCPPIIKSDVLDLRIYAAAPRLVPVSLSLQISSVLNRLTATGDGLTVSSLRHLNVGAVKK